MNDILLIRNDVKFSGKHKGVFERSFSKKDLCKTASMLGIKIYRDRSRCLIRLSQSTYLDKILKKFNMDQSKKGFLPVLQGVKLSSAQCPTTAEERESTKVFPYAFVIGSIRYAMLSTAPDVCLATCLARGYKRDQGVDHQTMVKIILNED